LGNYLGALKNFVSLQKKMKCIYCVVDLHAITVFQKPNELEKNVLETTASFLATGLDPNKSIIFNQSAVSGHSELAWILNCVSRIGWLNRMTQFKDKAGSDKEKASVGLYIYPNLMAADILLYKATHIPVGADQKQHLELSRDIAQKFNNDFKCDNFFPLPEPLISKNISRVMSLRDASKKMSKSEESEYSRINLKDSSDEIMKKIKKAKSDSEPIPDDLKLLEKKPEALNLLNIYSELSKSKLEKVLSEMAGKEYSFLKTKLAEILIEEIVPVGKEMKKLSEDKSHLKGILKKGSEKAHIIAEENLKNIRDIVGLI
jgi:tryptophanyl-tRNA synthetase